VLTLSTAIARTGRRFAGLGLATIVHTASTKIGVVEYIAGAPQACTLQHHFLPGSHVPYTHSEDRRHTFEKPLYKVTNGPAYNAALKRRGDFTRWFTEEAIAEWCPAKTGARGRPRKDSKVAIETVLFIRQVFHLALRQTEGFMNSLARALTVQISIPDVSGVSKRSIGLPGHALSKAMAPGSVVMVDATRLKVYGTDKWHPEKQDVAARPTWRKRHLAIDEPHPVLAGELTPPDAVDTTAVPDRLDQLTPPCEPFRGEGADHGKPVTQAGLTKQPAAHVIMAPHKRAVLGATGTPWPAPQIETIAQEGRATWQRITGDNGRRYVALAMPRDTRNFGNTMKARALARHQTGAWIRASALNRMTRFWHAGVGNTLTTDGSWGRFGLASINLTTQLPSLKSSCSFII